jgi:hypothetical protein
MNPPSRIQAEESQLQLFTSAQMDPALFAAEESGENPVFTGARLFATKPILYRAIVSLTAEGLGVRRIGSILHVSPNTVLAVRASEPELVDTEKRRLAGMAREGAKMIAESILEDMCNPEFVKKTSIKDRAIAFNVLSTQAELLSGSPTSRLQIINSSQQDMDVGEYCKMVRAEYDRRMGLRAGNQEQSAEADSAVERLEPAKGGLPPGWRKPVALLEAPKDHQDPAPIVDPGAKGTVGQTPHRSDDKPVNIDRNEGAQINVGIIISRDSASASASASISGGNDANRKGQLVDISAPMRRDAEASLRDKPALHPGEQIMSAGEQVGGGGSPTAAPP